MDVRRCGLTHIQLALEPIASGQWDINSLEKLLTQTPIQICSGMMQTVGEDYSTLETIECTGGIRPVKHWGENKRRAKRNALVAQQLGIELVTFHAGFIPKAGTLEYQTVTDRIVEIADIFGQHRVKLGLETGQERPEILLDLIEQPALSHVGVNFDPANMILYGSGNPAEAFTLLKHRIVQLHMKDAVTADLPNNWGTEVPAGIGEVDWDHFFTVAHSLNDTISIVIERESGDQRIADIIKARELALTHGCEL